MVVVLGTQIAFTDVGHVNDRLISQEVQLLTARCDRIGIITNKGTHRQARVQVFLQLAHRIDFLGQCLIGARLTANAIQTLFQALQVRQDQFGFDNFNIANRVHRPLHVHHVVIVKATHHFEDGIAFADVPQELVTQAFALRRTTHQACDIGEVHRGMDNTCTLTNLSQLFQTQVRYRHRGLIGFDCTKGIVRSFCVLRTGQSIKQRRFAHIRQSNNTNSKAHRHPP